MPQPDNDDLWPTTDDDHSSTAPTSELPVPDQQEQSESTDSADPGEPAPPKPATPADTANPAPEGDEPHPEPPATPQVTQPISWPIAELERNLPNAGQPAAAQSPSWPTTEPTRKAPEPTPNATEPTREPAEPARNTAESAREPAEPARNAAESAREAAEPGGKAAESARQAAEPARSAAGSAREAAELDRKATESARQDTEPGRSAAETAREAAEPGRNAAGSAREAAGPGRNAAESAREAAEPARRATESAGPGRSAAEPAWKAAESVQEAAERNAAEPAWKAESARQATEPGRNAVESARQAAEPGRSAAEAAGPARNATESARRAAEPGRNAAESARQAAESPRQTAEPGRKPAEPAKKPVTWPGEPEPRPNVESVTTRLPRDTPRPDQRDTRPDQQATSFVRPVPPKPPEDRRTALGYSRPVPRQAPNEAPTNFMRPAEPSRGEVTSFIRPASDWPPPEPPRAAPQRIGPTPPPEPVEHDEEETPEKKRRRPLLITAIAVVAVIGVAAGVIFGVPGLSDRLGITGEDPVAIRPAPGPVAYTPGLKPPDATAPAPTRQGVESALAGPIADPALGTVTGVVIDPTSGETLYERDAATAITPASTGKILTAAAALLALEPTYQLVTKVVEGENPGEVIIVGGGDPTLSSLKPGLVSMYPGAPHLTELVDKVKASGAQVQTVYIDQERYTGDTLAPTWIPADVAAGYITPIVPAMLDGGRADATVNYSPRTSNPSGVLVDEFAARIGATAPPQAEKKAPPNAKVLGEVRSAPLVQLIDNLLDHSDNVLGEILAHEVAIKTGKEPTFEGGSQATLDVLRQNGFNVDGVVLADGSGLSAANKVSAKVLADILAVAAGPDGKDERTAKLRPLLGGLPVAGGSGTLADRYDDAGTQEARGWLRAKTGSLTGVNSLAGIVLDKDNRPLVFAFLTGGTVSTTARPALDRVTAALRSCGCQ